MDNRQRTPLRTEVAWLLGVLLAALLSGLAGLAVYLARLRAL